MDDLTHLKARLRELVEAKVERIAALKVEIAAIEQELTEAQTILGAWGRPAASTFVPPSTYAGLPDDQPEDDFARGADYTKKNGRRTSSRCRARRSSSISASSARRSRVGSCSTSGCWTVAAARSSRCGRTPGTS
jgi:hypothetical protein